MGGFSGGGSKLGGILGKDSGTGGIFGILGKVLNPLIGSSGSSTNEIVSENKIAPPVSTPINEQTAETMRRKKVVSTGSSNVSAGALVPKTNKKTLLG